MTKASATRILKKQQHAKVLQMKKKLMIKLKPEDQRWFENCVMKEQILRKQLQDALLGVAKEAEEMMESISKREGVDMAGYDIDWKECKATLKVKAKTKAAVAKDTAKEAQPDD